MAQCHAGSPSGAHLVARPDRGVFSVIQRKSSDRPTSPTSASWPTGWSGSRTATTPPPPLRLAVHHHRPGPAARASRRTSARRSGRSARRLNRRQGHDGPVRPPPESTKNSLTWRLRQHARSHWPGLGDVQVRFRSNFAYVDGRLPDGEVIKLCRLRYIGSASRVGVRPLPLQPRRLRRQHPPQRHTDRQPPRRTGLRLRPLPQPSRVPARYTDELTRGSTSDNGCTSGRYPALGSPPQHKAGIDRKLPGCE